MMKFLPRFRPIKRRGRERKLEREKKRARHAEERDFFFPSELQQQSFGGFLLFLTTELGNPTSQMCIIASRPRLQQ
jgi:hypothetical protein